MAPNVQPQGRPSLLPNDIADAIANLFGGGDQNAQPGIGGAGNVIPPQIQQIIQQIAQQFQGVGPAQEPGQQGFVDPNAQGSGSVSDEELAQMLGGGGGQDQLQGGAGPDALQVDGAGQPASPVTPPGLPPQGQIDPNAVDTGEGASPLSVDELINTPIAGDAGQVADQLVGPDTSGGGTTQSDIGPQQAVSGEPVPSDVVVPGSTPSGGAAAKPALKSFQEQRKIGYIGTGVDEAYADELARMPPDQANALLGAYLRRHPIDRTPPIPDSAVEQLAGLHPTIADDIRAAHAAGQDQAIPGLVSQDVARINSDKQKPRVVDPTQYPEWMRPYIQNMSPDDVSKFTTKQLEAMQAAQSGGSDYWPRLKGKGIKIVNDDNFKRMGLKSGEKVCITIP